MQKVVAHDVPQWLLNWINMVDYTAIPAAKEAKIRQKLESGTTMNIISALTEIFTLPLKPDDHIEYYNKMADIANP